MTQTSPHRHMVLYADDDGDDIDFVESAFSSTTNNVELVTTQDGIETIEFLEKLSTMDPDPCLIILDVNMPKLNGRQTLLRIKQNDQLSNVPLVLFSTSSDPRDKEFAKRNGASYVVKPFSYENLKSVVQWFIDQCAVH